MCFVMGFVRCKDVIELGICKFVYVFIGVDREVILYVGRRLELYVFDVIRRRFEIFIWVFGGDVCCDDVSLW